MLLTIHNLPPSTEYSDVKELITSKCGLEYSILDNLQNEGCGRRVTVGVMSEEDAAILVRTINGLCFKGMQLYVEDKRKSQASEQPYCVNMQQPLHPMAQDPTAYYTALQSMGVYQYPYNMSNIAMFTPGPAPQTVENSYTAFGEQGPAMQMFMQQYGMVQFSQQGFIPHVQQQPSVEMFNQTESIETSTGVNWEDKRQEEEKDKVAVQESPARARSSEGGSRHSRGRIQDNAERRSPPRTHRTYSPNRNEKYNRGTSSSRRRSPDAREERYKSARSRLPPNANRDGFEPHVRISKTGFIRVRPKRVYSPKRNEKYDRGTSSSRRSPDATEERHKRARRRLHPNADRDSLKPHVRISKNGYIRARPKRVSSPTGDERSSEKKRLEELTVNCEESAESKRASQQRPVPVDTQVVAPAVAVKCVNTKPFKRNLMMAAIEKIMFDIAVNLNMVEEFANSSFMKEQIMHTVERQVMEIVGNGDASEPDEIFKLYRKQYTEKDDTYLLRDIMRTISEHPKDTPKVMEAKLKITQICQEAMEKEFEHRIDTAPIEQQCNTPRSIEEDNMYDNMDSVDYLTPIMATPSGSREGSPPLVDALYVPEQDLDNSTIFGDVSSTEDIENGENVSKKKRCRRKQRGVDKMLETMPLKTLKKVAKLVSTAVQARSTVTKDERDLITRGHGYIREIAVKEEIPTAVHADNIVSDLTVTKINRCRTYSNSVPVEKILEAVVSETLAKVPDVANTGKANTHTHIRHKSYEETSVYNEVSSSGIVETEYVEINTIDQLERNINSSRSKRALEDFAPAILEEQRSWSHSKDNLRLASEHKFQEDHYKDVKTEYNLRTDVYDHKLKDNNNLKGDSKPHPSADYEYRQENSMHVSKDYPQKQCDVRQIDSKVEFKDRKDDYIRSQEYKNHQVDKPRLDDKDLKERRKFFEEDPKGGQRKYEGRFDGYKNQQDDCERRSDDNKDRKEHCKGLEEDKDGKMYTERTDSDKRRLDDNKRCETDYKYRQLDHKVGQDRHKTAKNSLVSHGSKRREDDYRERKENYKLVERSPVRALKSQQDDRDRLFNDKYRQDEYIYRKREKSPIPNARFERKESNVSASNYRYNKRKLTPSEIGGASKSNYEPGKTQIARGTSSELKLPDDPQHPPIKYWNAELDSLRNESRRLYDIAINTQKEEDYEKYKSARRLYRSRLRPHVRKSKKEDNRELKQHQFVLTEQSDEDEDFLKALEELE